MLSGYEKLLFQINKNCLGPWAPRHWLIKSLDQGPLDKWWMNRQMLGFKKKM